MKRDLQVLQSHPYVGEHAAEPNGFVIQGVSQRKEYHDQRYASMKYNMGTRHFGAGTIAKRGNGEEEKNGIMGKKNDIMGNKFTKKPKKMLK